LTFKYQEDKAASFNDTQRTPNNLFKSDEKTNRSLMAETPSPSYSSILIGGHRQKEESLLSPTRFSN
jgi:hypothetical protein